MIETLVSWDELTEQGRIASTQLDAGRWTIGDLACAVAKDYGKDRINEFAREIGQKKETVKGYKRVARAFPESVRAKLFDEYPNLFYSHYRTAARLESPGEQIAFLEETASNGWTTDECEREMTIRLGGTPTPSKLLDTSAMVARTYSQDDGDYIVFRVGRGEIIDLARRNVRLIVQEES